MRNKTHHIDLNNSAGLMVQECAAWKEMLQYLEDESYTLKTRLSEMVDRKGEKDFLEVAEYYQNLFVLNKK
jgi:predicted nuclease with TOPRIM domain